MQARQRLLPLNATIKGLTVAALATLAALTGEKASLVCALCRQQREQAHKQLRSQGAGVCSQGLLAAVQECWLHFWSALAR